MTAVMVADSWEKRGIDPPHKISLGAPAGVDAGKDAVDPVLTQLLRA